MKSFMELPSGFCSHRSPWHSPFPGTDAELHFIGMLSVHSIALRLPSEVVAQVKVGSSYLKKSREGAGEMAQQAWGQVA